MAEPLDLQYPKRSTVIHTATVRPADQAIPSAPHPDMEESIFPLFNRSNMFLFDPERPLEDPNDMYNRMGGQMRDPYSMDHGCPYCGGVMRWELFCSHMRACFTRNRKVVLDITKRKFTGATLILEVT